MHKKIAEEKTKMDYYFHAIYCSVLVDIYDMSRLSSDFNLNHGSS